jgi:hypothetical protein
MYVIAEPKPRTKHEGHHTLPDCSRCLRIGLSNYVKRLVDKVCVDKQLYAAKLRGVGPSSILTVAGDFYLEHKKMLHPDLSEVTDITLRDPNLRTHVMNQIKSYINNKFAPSTDDQPGPSYIERKNFFEARVFRLPVGYVKRSDYKSVEELCAALQIEDETAYVINLPDSMLERLSKIDRDWTDDEQPRQKVYVRRWNRRIAV